MNAVKPNESDQFELSIRINSVYPNQYEIFRVIPEFVSHQTVSFRSNPKLIFNPNQSEAHSKAIRGQFKINPNESGQTDQLEFSIRMNPVYPNHSGISINSVSFG